MKKRVTSLFLALLMAFTLLPVQALADELATPGTTMDTHQAAEVQEPVEAETEADALVPQESPQDAAPLSTGAVYTGTLGENVNWSLDTGTGTLTVTGSGPMGDYDYEKSPLWNYRGYIKSVTIADTVNSVGRDVFRGCSNLVDIDLGCGITEIHVEAFWNCDRLEEIVIPDSVTSIDYGAFYGCYGLTEIVIPDSVATIGDYTFGYCHNLTSITMGSGITSIASNAFDYCSKLNKVVISDLTAWLKISFNGYKSNPLFYAHALYAGDDLLTDLVIPGTVTDINQYAFYGCTSITSVYIPQSVKSIGQSAFNGMSSLKTVRYAGSQADWLKIDIGSYNEPLINLTPEFDQSLVDYYHITTVATEHGTVAVDNAMAKVGDTVTITAIPAPGYAVESYLVDGVAIPNGGNTFTAAGDHVVTATFVKAYDVADNGKACGDCGTNIKWALDTEGTLYVYGTGVMRNYSYSDSPFYPYHADIKAVQFSDGITTIGTSAFQECGGLTEIVIPASVTTIGDYAFGHCRNLTSITMGNGVTTIDYGAFDYCSKLNKVVISDLAAWLKISFGDSSANPLYTAHTLYVGDELLTNLVIPGTMTEISQYAFDGCTSITSVYIPQSVKSIGQYAFNGMSSLKTVRYAGSQDDWLKIDIGSYNDSLTDLTPEYDQSLADYCRITTAATEHGTVVVDNAMAKVGDTVTITAIPAPGYAVESYLVDGVAIPDGGNTFTAAKDHVVTATFVKAYNVADNGKACGDCGANIKWALDTTGMLHVYGTGAMYDYNGNNGGPFYRYCNDIKSVQFSGGITTIGDWTFFNCTNLFELVIPASVVSIGNYAFSECRGLSEIIIPDSVTTINDWAFEACGLTSAEFLGNAPISFGSNVFRGISSNFVIFYHSGTTGWTSPTWNGYNAVCCDNVITDYSTLDDNNRNAQGIYFKLNWLSQTAVVGDGSKQQNSCGYTGGQQGAVVIPDTVTKGGTTYTVKGINQYAFEGCPFVRSVTLGANISTVAPTAFWNCKNLTAFSVSKSNTFFKAYDGVLYDLSGLYLYVYPDGKSNTSYTPLATCRTIGKTAFFGARNLTVLNIPATVTAILEGAFAFCPNLQEITLPFIGGSAKDSQTYPFRYVFDSDIDDWYSLRSDTDLEEYFYGQYERGNIPSTLKTVTVLQANLSYDSFSGCTQLEEIFFPNCNDLTTIPEYCFNGCSSLTRLLLGQSKSSMQTGILIPASVTKIEYAAFAGCSRISQFVVTAGNTAFTADQWGVLYSRDMSVLRYYPAGREWPYYNVNDRTRTIDAFAFMNCGELVNVYIPKTVTKLEFEAISQCPMVTFCVYCDSAADLYMSQHSLTAWYMDNCTLQNIEIIHLPDQVISAKNKVLASSLYAKGAYSNEGQTIELQLEDYTLSLSQPYGTQEVTLSSGGKTVTFEAPVIRQGNINGNATAQSDIDASDMQCLYELLTTGQCQSQIKNRKDLYLVADVNGDDTVDVYDLQLLYEAVSGISKL